MNKIYKLVWSKVRNTWVVASEIAKGHGKESSSGRNGKRLKLAVMTAILGGCFMTAGISPVTAELTKDQKAVYDAVLQKLETEKKTVHYFSVKSDDSANPDGTNWNNDGATGNDAVAAGRYAKAYGNQSQATGRNAWAIGGYSQASGYNAVAAAEKGIDAATYNALSDEEKQNYKLNTQSEGTKNTSLYYRTKFKEYTNDEFNALPVMEQHRLTNEKGYRYDKEKEVWTLAPGAVAIGHAAKAIGLSTLAVGDLAEATAKYAVAVGRETEATDVGNTALGYYAKAKGLRSTALGVATRATDFESMAVGPYARAEGKVSLALGSNAHAKGNNSIAMGRRSESTGESSIALGGSAKTQAQGSVAIGMMAESRQKGSVALGEASLADREAGVWGHDISTGQKMNEDALLGAGKAAYDAEKTKLTELEGQEQALRNEYEASLAQDQVAPNGNHIPSAATQAIKNKLDAKIAEVDTQAIKVANTVKTWRATSGALSVGNTGLAVTRQITGVAAGTEDTDAVNVAQLKALNKKVDKSGVHYFSVNSDDKKAPDGTNWNNDGATGNKAVAIGKKTKAGGINDIAIGTEAAATGKFGFAAGHQAKSSGNADIAIGDNAEATGGWGVAIGQDTKAQASTAVAMAYGAKATGANSLAIGVQSEARTNDSTAYGREAKALGEVALAVGMRAKAEGDHSAVFGAEATTDSTAWNGTAIGRGAYIGKQAPDGTTPDIGVSNNYYTPVDDDTTVEPGKKTMNSTAVGFAAKSFGYQNTALGAGAEAFDTNTVAVGVMSKAIGHYANALGKQARAEGMNSTAIGHFARALGESSMALGDYAITSTLDGTGKVNRSVAFGSHARVAADNSLALGYNSLASIADDVKTEAYLSKETFKKENGVVSVGNKEYTVGNEKIKQNYRRIINVAGGADDTDAVNVAQLKALNTKVDQGAIHYFSVKSDDSAKPAGTNWNNDGATGQDAIAIGKNAVSEGQDAIAIGKNAVSDRQESTAIGSQAQAYQYYSTAIGSTAIAGSHYSTALGYGAQADLNRSTAIGSTAIAGGHYSTALGYGAQADWTYSTALGGNADAQGLHSTALGGIAKAQGHYSTVLGYKAEALADGSVALGNDAVAGREAGTVGYFASASGTTLDDVLTALDKKTDYDNWTATINASKAEYERLTNAYFNASESDKAAAKAALDTWKEQHKAFVKALEERTRLEATWKASRGAVSVGADGFDEAGNTIIESRQITNVAAGTEDTDAVNVAQLKVVNEKADKNATDITNLTKTVNANGKATIVKVDGKEESTDGNLKITKKTENGQTTYDLSLSDEITIGKDGKDGKIGINGKDGASAEITVGKGEPGVDGKDGETITRIIYTDKDGKEHKVATLDDGLKFKGDNDTVVTRKLNTQLNITGGITDKAELSNNNIGVVGTQDGGMAIKLSKKLKGLTSAEFVDGDKVTNITAQTITQKDGDNITNITGGNVTITRKEGNVDLWELNKTVNNITAGTTDVSSWKLQANGKDERIIKKDSVVNFKNGENTKVTVNGNDVTVDLNDATKKQISDNTTKINEIDGKVTNIENKVNNIETNIDTKIEQKIEGAKITVEGDTTTGVKATEVKTGDKVTGYKVSLDKKVTVGNVTIDGKDDKGEITGLTNTTIDADDFATKGRAATEEQLKKAMAATQEASRTMVKAGDNITVTPATEGASEYTFLSRKIFP